MSLVPVLYRLRCRLLFLSAGACALAGLTEGGEPPVLAGITLEAGLQQAIGLFRGGQYPAAAIAFDELDRTFGREPEFLAASVQRVILPMRGYTAMAIGEPNEAVGHFTRYLETTAIGSDERWAAMLYSLAQALEQAERLEEAVARYEQLAEKRNSRPEAALAKLRAGELLVRIGRTSEAIAHWRTVQRAPVSQAIRQDARLLELQALEEADDLDAVAECLLRGPWHPAAVSNRADLGFTALRVGDALLAGERYSESVAAYRLVPPHASLSACQARTLQKLKVRLERPATGLFSGAEFIWREHERRSLQRVAAHLAHLQQIPEYTGDLYLRFGQAFSGAGRHHEAWVVFAAVAEDAGFSDALRQSAHFRWLGEAHALSRWEDGLRIASGFVDRYPDAPQAPLAFFLMANAYQELQDHGTAAGILTQLLERYPVHPSRSRWVFARGFSRLFLEHYAGARTDFRAFMEERPHAPTRVNAELWHAVSWYFEKQHEQALGELDALLGAIPPDHYLRPEVIYRRATVRYALRMYSETLTDLDLLLELAPTHARAPESAVLRGDVLMALGRLIEAATQFRQIEPNAGALFPYAVFQAGKIYRALEEYEVMARHFTRYVERTDLQPHPRVSEALHWIGWALGRQGNHAEAIPVFEDALERFGNDPEAPGVSAMLAELAELLQVEDADADSPTAFSDWLKGESARAREAEQWTYWSRLRLFEANRLQLSGHRAEAQAIRFQLAGTVPIHVLDAEGLAETGRILQEQGDAGSVERFNLLLKRFPAVMERSVAYLGLASEARKAGDLAASEDWCKRLVDEFPAHPLMIDATLLRAEVLIALKRSPEAEVVLEDLLRLRSARGRPHAEALLLLACAAESEGRLDVAIACYQRVYNLYRGYVDLAARAYFQSAELFEAKGDLRAAWRTYREVVHLETNRGAHIKDRAAQEMTRLAPLLPPEPNDQETEQSDGELREKRGRT